MDDLISRQAAIDILDAYQVMVENGEENPYTWARLRMSELQSAQPEIIRCKDCKYARLTYDGSCKYCDIWFPDEAQYMDGDYYCASAERKEHEGFNQQTGGD